MLFNDKSFKITQAGLDMLLTKQKVITNNIANEQTPGFKASRVSFSAQLEKAKDGKDEVGSLNMKVTKDSSTSNRPDGNNVDMEQQQLELWETYAQFSYLSQNLTNRLKNMRYVINNTGR